MTEADELAAWIGERLDEAGALAEAAASGPGPDWHAARAVVAVRGGTVLVVAGDDDEADVADAYRDGRDRAAHIARWDPAAVLRDVEAKRMVLAEWAAWSGIAEGMAVRGEPRDVGVVNQAAAWERAMRMVGSAWDGQPGYKDAWKP